MPPLSMTEITLAKCSVGFFRSVLVATSLVIGLWLVQRIPQSTVNPFLPKWLNRPAMASGRTLHISVPNNCSHVAIAGLLSHLAKKGLYNTCSALGNSLN